MNQKYLNKALNHLAKFFLVNFLLITIVSLFYISALSEHYILALIIIAIAGVFYGISMWQIFNFVINMFYANKRNKE